MPVTKDDAPVEPPARGDVAAAGEDEPEDRPIAPGEQRDGRRRARRRAARRSQAARLNTLATRRGELVAASRAVAAAAADASSHTSSSRRRGGLLRRAVAIVALLLLPATGWMLVLREAAGAPALSRADGSYLSAQVVAADHRVRTQLAHLRDRATARALDRTRESIATMRSLAFEIGRARGAEAGRLRAALRREGAWLDAVRSTLSNPRSPLRAQLAIRDRALRRALAALRTRAAPREGAARHLVDYARSRVRAAVDQEKSASLTQ